MRTSGTAHATAGVLLALALALAGCGHAIRGRTLKVHTQKPSNVVVVFQLEEMGQPAGPLSEPLGLGTPEAPVAKLGAEHFRLYEGEFEIPLGPNARVVNADLRPSQHVLLLLDLSGDPSSERVAETAEAARAFVAALPAQRVGVYAFTGSSEPDRVVALGTPRAAATAALERFARYEPRDPSTDLNGSVISALGSLREAVDGSSALFATGVLVLVSRGPDRAARADLAKLREVLDADDELRIAVGIGPGAEQAPLADIASGQPVLLRSEEGLADELRRLAERIDAYGRSYYILSYCSLARAGTHRGRIEISRTVKNAEGDQSEQRGSLDFDVVADGFEPGCTPTAVPENLIARPDAVVQDPDSIEEGLLEAKDAGGDAAPRPAPGRGHPE